MKLIYPIMFNLSVFIREQAQQTSAAWQKHIQKLKLVVYFISGLFYQTNFVAVLSGVIYKFYICLHLFFCGENFIKA